MGFNTAEISYSEQWRFFKVAIDYKTEFGFKNARRMQYT